MSQTPTVAPTTNTVPHKQKGLMLRLIIGIFVVVAIALAVVVRWQTVPVHDPLRGDAEETANALDTKIGKMPRSTQDEQLRKFAQDPSPGLRFNAIDKLSERHDPAVTDILESAYTDSSAVVRQRILETLPDTDPKRGLILLLRALHDEDRWMREAAITQLKSRYGTSHSIVDKNIVPALMTTLDDGSSAVSFTAIHLLQKLTGNTWTYKALAPDAEKQAVHQQWKKWWQTAQAKWPTTSDLSSISPSKPTRQDPAPCFQIQDIDGKPISLAGQKGHLTLINFWGTWCAPCQQEVPDLVRVDNDLRSHNVDVVGVALSENSADSLRKWCTEHHVAYRQSLAQDRMLKDFGDIHEVPISVLIDGKGNVRRRWEGERDYATFRTAIEDVLAKP